MSEVEELKQQLALERERADYAWKNVRAIEAENARLRYHLTELGKFADRAGVVLATLDPEDATEGEMLQEIIDGISTWAAPAILGEAKGPNGNVSGGR